MKRGYAHQSHNHGFVALKVFKIQMPVADQLAELKDQLLRARADLRNAQMRMVKDQAQLVFASKESLLQGMVSTIDDFERALAEYGKQSRNEQLDTWFAGFELIIKRLHQFLVKQGVHEIDCSHAFDPRYHEALAYVANSDKKSGDIIQVFRKGYLLNDRVLRPAQVSVAQ